MQLLKNKQVIYFSMSHLMSKLVEQRYRDNYKMNLLKEPPRGLWVNNPASCRGYSNDSIILEDNTIYRLYMTKGDRLDGVEVYKNRFGITTV
jgi:hypothetical protein